MVADDPVPGTALDHVGRHVGLGAVDEAGHDVARPVQLGHRIQLVLVQKALHQGAIDLLAHPAVGAVDDVVDGLARGQLHVAQVAQGVVGVGGGAGGRGLPGQVPGLVVGVGGAAVPGEPILGVVIRGDRPRRRFHFGPVAVGVVGVVGHQRAVPGDPGEAAGLVVGVVPSLRGAAHRLGLRRDPAQLVAGVGGLVDAGSGFGDRPLRQLAEGVVGPAAGDAGQAGRGDQAMAGVPGEAQVTGGG